MPTVDVDRDTAHEAARHELARPIPSEAVAVRPDLAVARRPVVPVDPAGVGRPRWLVHRHRPGDHRRRRPVVAGAWRGAPCGSIAPTISCSTSPNAPRPHTGARQEQHAACGNGPPPSGSGCAPWPASSRRTALGGARPYGRGTGARRRRAVFPALSSQFTNAAAAFNDVAYGEMPGTSESYRIVADLDDRLREQLRAPGAGDDDTTGTTGLDTGPVTAGCPAPAARRGARVHAGAGGHRRGGRIDRLADRSTGGGGLMNPDSTSTDGAHTHWSPCCASAVSTWSWPIRPPMPGERPRTRVPDACCWWPRRPTSAPMHSWPTWSRLRATACSSIPARRPVTSWPRESAPPRGLQHADPDCDLRAAQQAGAVISVTPKHLRQSRTTWNSPAAMAACWCKLSERPGLPSPWSGHRGSRRMAVCCGRATPRWR